MANHPHRWTLHIPERKEASIMDDVEIFRDLIPTCRLLTLTQEEFEGTANQVLKDALQSDDDFVIAEKLNNASEFRSMVCLARLIDEFLRIIPDPIPRAAMESLKQTWADIAQKARRDAQFEPMTKLPGGWREYRNEKSGGHAYYIDEQTNKATWVRPLPDNAETDGGLPLLPREARAAVGDDGQPLKRASLIARSAPCSPEMSDWMLGK